ncbi:NYN domain-containing protein [Vannielia sp. SX4]|uniref:NYN domain-containing protein n=1 Tax=Vannielia sp. SX4 TaxID=3463852 RepID=UPI004059C02A
MSNESPHAPPCTALLIDGDNISAAHANALLAAAPDAHVARVYADTTHAERWSGRPALETIRRDQGANSVDIALALDALELALTRGFTRFVIATSDGDFSQIARRLRAHGCVVTGIGGAHASKAFQASCTQFQKIPGTAPCDAQAGPTDLDRKVRSVIQSHSQNGRGMLVALLSTEMKQEHDFKISGHVNKTWRAYLAARQTLYDLDPRGPEAMVRFRPEGFK